MKIALLLYPGVEPIDLAAIGVVSMARRVLPQLSYVTVAEHAGPVVMSNGLRVLADQGFAAPLEAQVLVVPGGPGWVAAAADPSVLNFVRVQAPRCILLSVCTGAMVLAAAGVLDGLPATTKVETVPPEVPPLQLLAQRHPAIDRQHALLVDAGRVITGGGVSLCVDAMLYLLEREFGAAAVDEVARILEYRAARDANRARLPTVTESA